MTRREHINGIGPRERKAQDKAVARMMGRCQQCGGSMGPVDIKMGTICAFCYRKKW